MKWALTDVEWKMPLMAPEQLFKTLADCHGVKVIR